MHHLVPHKTLLKLIKAGLLEEESAEKTPQLVTSILLGDTTESVKKWPITRDGWYQELIIVVLTLGDTDK